MSPTKNTSGPLSEISPNTASPSKATTTEKTTVAANDNDALKMPATASFPIRNDHTTTYVSPSDAMMSPTSKKLSEIKGRKLAGAKQLNGRDLFAKARALNGGARSNYTTASTTEPHPGADSTASSQSSDQSS